MEPASLSFDRGAQLGVLCLMAALGAPLLGPNAASRSERGRFVITALFSAVAMLTSCRSSVAHAAFIAGTVTAYGVRPAVVVWALAQSGALLLSNAGGGLAAQIMLAVLAVGTPLPHDEGAPLGHRICCAFVLRAPVVVLLLHAGAPLRAVLVVAGLSLLGAYREVSEGQRPLRAIMRVALRVAATAATDNERWIEQGTQALDRGLRGLARRVTMMDTWALAQAAARFGPGREPRLRGEGRRKGEGNDE